MKMTTTKLELVAYHLREESSKGGCSALSGLSMLHDLNLRNSVSDLRKAGVTILDKYFEHHYTGGGTMFMKRYRVGTAEDVRKLVALVNLKRSKRGAAPISFGQKARYLESYKNNLAKAKA